VGGKRGERGSFGRENTKNGNPEKGLPPIYD